jgi:histone-lysine N-methyltransferase MLL2
MTLQNIKQEPGETQCDSGSPAGAHPGAIKREELMNCGHPSGFINAENMGGDPGTLGRSETGQQLLQKLLRTKNHLAAQRPSEGIHNEINGHINSKLAMLEQKLQGTPRNMEVSSAPQPVGGSFPLVSCG